MNILLIVLIVFVAITAQTITILLVMRKFRNVKTLPEETQGQKLLDGTTTVKDE
jgi:hypothetical protein